MLNKEILKEDVLKLAELLAKKFELIAPVKKGEDFVFAKIRNPKKIDLDYTTTILPPTKLFMPLREKLFDYQIQCLLNEDKLRENKITVKKWKKLNDSEKGFYLL